MNIIVFGDSITQGFDDTEYGGWVNRLFIHVSARHVGQAHDDYCAVFNLGISGDTTDALLKRIEVELHARADDNDNLIIFDIGGNDSVRHIASGECQVPLQRFVENYRTLMMIAQKRGRVVCLGIHDSNEECLDPMPYYAGHAVLNEDAIKYDQAIQELAAEQDVLYISMKGILSSDFSARTYDGDHPSAEGHRLIYERVKMELEHATIL